MPSARGKVDSERQFVFRYSSAGGQLRELRTSISLASCDSPAEMSHRLLRLHKLPCYLQHRKYSLHRHLPVKERNLFVVITFCAIFTHSKSMDGPKKIERGSCDSGLTDFGNMMDRQI